MSLHQIVAHIDIGLGLVAQVCFMVHITNLACNTHWASDDLSHLLRFNVRVVQASLLGLVGLVSRPLLSRILGLILFGHQLIMLDLRARILCQIIIPEFHGGLNLMHVLLIVTLCHVLVCLVSLIFMCLIIQPLLSTGLILIILIPMFLYLLGLRLGI